MPELNMSMAARQSDGEDELTPAQKAQRARELAMKKRADWAKKMLERRIAEYKASPEGQLIAAAEKNDVEALMTALQRDPQLNFPTDETHQYPGYTALHFAAHHGNTEMVIALLMCGAHTAVHEKFGYTPLHLSAIADQPVSSADRCPHVTSVRSCSSPCVLVL